MTGKMDELTDGDAHRDEFSLALTDILGKKTHNSRLLIKHNSFAYNVCLFII